MSFPTAKSLLLRTDLDIWNKMHHTVIRLLILDPGTQSRYLSYTNTFLVHRT
jgi:hypothetical protein